MNFLKPILYLSIFSFLIISCSDDIKNKQEALFQREQSLIKKEKELAVKEVEYQSLLKMRDSINATKDSVAVHPMVTEIAGAWKGKIVCTESNCSSYVVGDTRIDDWEISSGNGEVIAKNLSKTGSVRIYKGNFSGNNLILKYSKEPAATEQIDYKIDFSTVTPTKLSGIREVQVDKACTSKFTIELTR